MQTTCIDHDQRGNPDGYGFAYFGGKTYAAHRVVFALANGLAMSEISGKVIRHTCDNPRCVNHEHLVIGTQADNRKDCFSRGRTKFPPKLSDSQVIEIRKTCVPNTRNSDKSFRAFARKFGIDSSAVRKVFLGLTYKEVSNG